MRFCVVVGFGLGGGPVAQRAVESLPIVEHLDVFRSSGVGLGLGREQGAMREFLLEAREEALRGGVVPALTG